MVLSVKILAPRQRALPDVSSVFIVVVLHFESRSQAAHACLRLGVSEDDLEQILVLRPLPPQC